MSFQMTVFAEGVERQCFCCHTGIQTMRTYDDQKKTVFKEVRKGCVTIGVPFLMYSPKRKACSISAGSVSPRFSKPRTDLP